MATTKKIPKAAFPKKATPPRPEEFAARLPLASGKRLDATRAFLKKQKGVAEDLFHYGPKTGWAFRYLRGTVSVCVLTVRGERPLGIVSLEAAASGAVDWKALSPVGQKARKDAHGSPSLLWLYVFLDGTGAADFKAILKVKLRSLPEGSPAQAA